MAYVGFKGISIQRSTDGVSGWTVEKSLCDDLAQNTYIHQKVNESVSVTGGYYYRVVLDHYAKETGWFFPSQESITNYSNVVWVST
jgi:hemerythrin superfamily protein